MNLEIITPDKKLFEGQVKSAVFPGSEGSFGLLNNHAAMIATLKKADVQVYEPSSAELASFKSAANAVAGQVVGKIGGQSKQIYDKIQKAKAACGG